MIFIINIIGPNNKTIFYDLFHMDSESEVFTQFLFPNKKLKPSERAHNYQLRIETSKAPLIRIGLNSIAEVNNTKKMIYDIIISKQEEYLLQNRLL